MTQPYSYVITWYPYEKNSGKEAQILYSGTILGSSQKDVFSKMVDMVDESTHDPEEIEFMAKPFLDDDSCKTRKELDVYIAYIKDLSGFNSTAPWSDTGFQHFFPSDFPNKIKLDIPKAMMMIDVLGLLRNDNTL